MTGIRHAKLVPLGNVMRIVCSNLSVVTGMAGSDVRKRAGWPALAGVLLPLGAGLGLAQETVSLDKVPGQPIDATWYRYENEQYGLEDDIPAAGYAYEVGEEGDELALDSPDGERSISIYGSQDVDPKLTGNELKLAFAALAAAQIDAMRLGGIEITQEHIEPFWFEVAATDATYLYYQKGLVAEHCPTLTANLWIKFPVEMRGEFDDVVKRMSQSLSIECAAQ